MMATGLSAIAAVACLRLTVDGLRERDQLRDELRESQARLVAAADAERGRMERDLHDGAQQRLAVSGLLLDRIGERVDREAATALAQVRAEIDAAQADLRALTHGRHPPALSSGGLPAALGQAAERAGVPAPIDCEGVDRFSSQLEIAVYFCCLEALQNTVKHGGDGVSARITLARTDDGGLQFTIADTGPGFDPARVEGSYGLRNMRDRIGALGGTLDIKSAPGAGTTVRGKVPAV